MESNLQTPEKYEIVADKFYSGRIVSLPPMIWAHSKEENCKNIIDLLGN